MIPVRGAGGSRSTARVMCMSPDNADVNYTSTGDIVTVKYNSSGVQQWQAFYNGPMNLTDYASQLTVGPTGDVYVLGTSHGGVTDNDIVLLKYRGSDGVLMWVDRVDGPAHGSDGPGSLIMSSSGDVIVAGGISMANGRTDGILLRYSPTGTRTVLMQYDGEVGGHDSFGLTAIDRDNNLFVGGWSVGTSGMSEPVYFKFSPGGLLEWEGRYSMGPANRTNGSVLTVGRNGTLAIGGYGDYRSPGYPVVVAAIGQFAVDVAPARENPPVTYALRQNYPNPFNPSTTIRWELPLASQVRLVVYDILGREVAVLVDGRLPAGVHEKLLDASGLPSGVYLCRLQAGGYTETRKMLLVEMTAPQLPHQTARPPRRAVLFQRGVWP